MYLELEYYKKNSLIIKEENTWITLDQIIALDVLFWSIKFKMSLKPDVVA